MKKIFFLILFTLQFSFFCFSQSDSLHHYTDSEIAKISDYIANLEKKTPPENLSAADLEKKEQIAMLLGNSSHAYTDLEVIKLNDYIKNLERVNSVASVEKTPSNDSLHAYTDAEIVKLTNHVAELEKKVTAVNASGLNIEEQRQIAELFTIPSHEYTDAQVIKLANYIKHLTRLDSLNSIAVVAKVTEKTDSTKDLTLTKPVGYGNEYKLEEAKDIDKFQKLIYFNFNSDLLKQESYKPLDDVVKILKSYVNLNFVVEGYCDSVGSIPYNLNLSKRRAGTVKKYIISKGIPADRISAIGFGKDFPVATNKTEEGRAQNRRVLIKAKRKN